MRPTKVMFQRTVNTGNYENVRLAVEVQIDEGEGAAVAMNAARRFIEREARKHDPNAVDELRQWEAKAARSRTILHDPDSYSPREQRTAHDWLENNPRPADPAEDTETIL